MLKNYIRTIPPINIDKGVNVSCRVPLAAFEDLYLHGISSPRILNEANGFAVIKVSTRIHIHGYIAIFRPGVARNMALIEQHKTRNSPLFFVFRTADHHIGRA